MVNDLRDQAFLLWWQGRHGWTFTGSGLYETRFKQAFCSGYDAALAEMGGVRVSDLAVQELRDVVDMAEIDYQSEVEDAENTGERPDLSLWEVGISLPCAQEILAAIEPGPQEPETYTIGDLTMDKVFRAAGLTDASDMQAVFDQVEVALRHAIEPAPVSVREAARVLLDEWRQGEGPLGELCCYSLDEGGTMQPDIDGRWVEFTKIEAALFRAIAEGKDDE